MTATRGSYRSGYCKELVFVPDGSDVCVSCLGDGAVSIDGTHGERVEACAECSGNGYVARVDDQLEAEMLASIDVVAARKAMARRSA
jgi:DnaJ-class molecular chaperone